MSASEREELRRILRDLRVQLASVTSESAGMLREDLRGSAAAAFQEVIPAFERADDALRTDALDQPTVPEGPTPLANAGLSGISLGLKVQGVRGALGRWIQEKTPRALQRFLGWSNIILGSLATLIPAVEPIKEFKESIELAVEDKES